MGRFSTKIQQCIWGTTKEPAKSNDSHSGGVVEHDDNDSFSSHFVLYDVNGEKVPPRDNNTLEYMLQYSVPSQSQNMELNNPEINLSSCSRQGLDAWNDYGHIYSQICKLVDKNGKKGREAFLKGLNAIRIEQTDLMGSTIIEGSVSAGPKLSTKRKAIHKANATSPQKTKNR